MATLEELLQIALGDLDFRRRQSAMAELTRQSPRELASVCESLKECFRSEDIQHQRRALQLIGALGMASSLCLPEVLGALQSTHWTVREVAAKALGAVGAGSALAREGLVRCALHDRSPLVRTAAGQALEQLAGQIPAAVSELRQVLGHPHERVRCRALRALAALAKAVPDLAEILTAALGDSHTKVRRTAAELFGGLEDGALPFLPVLLRRCYDGDVRVGRAATASWKRLQRHLPPTFADWFTVGEVEPTQPLMGILSQPTLPAAIRQGVLEVCTRRAVWYGRRLKASTLAIAAPPVSAEQAVERVLSAAELAAVARLPPRRTEAKVRLAARQQEAAWLLAWLWGKLQQPRDQNRVMGS